MRWKDAGRRSMSAALLFLLVFASVACGRAETPPDVEAAQGPRPVPYTRRTVTTPAATVPSAQDYRDRVLPRSGAGEPTPPEALTVPPYPPQSSLMTTTTASGVGESTTPTAPASTSTAPSNTVSSAECKQYGEFLRFIAEMLQVVDPNDAAKSAANLARPMAASRQGLEQLATQPVPAVAEETVAVINWLNNKARGAVADDKAFEAALLALRAWHGQSC